MGLVNDTCLVLNRSFCPYDVNNTVEAINMAYSGRARIVHPDSLQTFSFDEWVAKGVETGAIIQTARLRFDKPEIIQVTTHTQLFRDTVAFTKSNVFQRDGRRCWYCGADHVKLTIDHVLPRCRGGKDVWTNVITACSVCNNRKGDMLVQEWCERMNCELPKPWNPNSHPWLFKVGKRPPPSWMKFVGEP